MTHTYRAWTRAILLALAITCAGLWTAGGGTYFVKAITESHNILLAAANVADAQSLLVQDVAASPEKIAHPYWYIHHPNLFAKMLSLALGSIDLGLSGQVAILLGLNVLGLLLVAAALRRFSAAAPLGALIMAATSYGSFHFNAGDLCRGPLYLLLWPMLYALVANAQLKDRWLNAVVAVASALSILSDWGFGLFVATFAFCWTAVGRGHAPWRWFLLTVALPMAGALSVYELTVISAVGFDFFLFDAKVTYLGRLGVGDYLNYQSLLSRFHDANVVIWPAQGRGTGTILQLIATVAVMPLLTTGPAWVLLFPVVVVAAVLTLSRLGLGGRSWLIIAMLVALNGVGLLPMPVLLIVLGIFAVRLVRVPMDNPERRLCALITAVVLGLAAPGLIFPSFTMSFTIAGGRPPFPLLEMSAAALVAELIASGALARAFGPSRDERHGRLHTGALIAVAASLVATLITVGTSSGTFFSIPKDLVVGLAVLVAGAPLMAAVWFYARAADGAFVPRWLALMTRWQIAVLLVVAVSTLAMHKSANPAILGRFSASYLYLLSVVAFSAGAAILLALLPRLRTALGNALSRSLAAVGGLELQVTDQGARAAAGLAALLIAAQAGWFILSIIAQPPRPIPYAQVLERPEFRGKSFLSTSYEAIVWYSTGGWAYMTPANPPPEGPLSGRFRHFADWRDEAKYGRPDFYLCDNSRYAYVRPGMSIEGQPVGKMACTTCYLPRRYSRARSARGHEAVVDGDDFSIVKFRWAK